MMRRKNKTSKNEQANSPLVASHDAKPQAVVADSSRDRLRPWRLCGMTALVVARPMFPS